MKKQIELSKAYLKKVFSDLHNVFVGIAVAAIVSGGGIYLFFRNLWTQLKSIAQSPTPLWVTIVLVLLVMEYMYLKNQRNSKKTSPPSFGFVDNGHIKWKVHLVNGTVYSIENDPYCVIHDLQLLHFKGGYVCSHVHEDGCESQLKDTDYDFRKKYIETLAERQFRRPEKV